MVRIALRPVGQPASYGYNLHIRAVVANIITYLLQTAQYREVRDGVGKYNLSAHGQACGHSRHVLFGNTYIDVTIREPIAKTLQYRVAQIATKQPNTLLLCCQVTQLLDKCCSHWQPPSSSRAFCSNSALGER